MSTNRCILIPKAPNGKPSKLFQDIQNHVKNREIAKRLWAFTQTDLFKSEFSDLKMDENGEITYEEYAELLDIDSVLSKAEKDDNLARDLRITTPSGNPAVFDTAQQALSKADEFNERAERKVAVVSEENEGEFVAKVVDSTPLDIAEADQNKARAELNVALIRLLNRAGFDVSFVDKPEYSGIFNPLKAEQNANMLRTVIRVAKGEAGYNALPEEVSHLIIAGMKNHALVQRAENLFTDDVVREILGDRYDHYFYKYSGKSTPVEELMREEAMGQAMADLLKERAGVERENSIFQRIGEGVRNLLQRIYQGAMRLFGKMDTREIDNAIINARNSLKPIAEMMESGEFDPVLDQDLIMKHEAMYELNSQVQKMTEIAQEGETLLSKKLYIIQNTQSKSDTRALRKTIDAVRQNLENQQYVNACLNTLLTIGTDVKQLMRQAALLGWVNNNTANLNVISTESKLLNDISTAIQAYTPYLETLANLPTLAQRGDVAMRMEDARSIAQTAKEHIDALNTLKADLRQMRFSVLKQLISMYYGDNGQKPENFEETEYNKWESVDAILSHAHADISSWDTTLFSAGDSKNPLINVIHNIVVRQQAKRNNRINKLTAKMQEAEKKLQDAGYDNSFVYQKDADGDPTGFYVAPVDMARYEHERQSFIDALDEQDLDYYEYQAAINKWDDEHTDLVEFDFTDSEGDKVRERMPKQEIYGVQNFQQGWSAAQIEYYNSLMQMKAEMDSLLPGAMHTLYLAPQVRRSTSQMFDEGGKRAIQTIWGKWKSKYTITEDNDDYGQNAVGIGMDGKKYTLLDFSGQQIKRVPIYFVHKLENQRDLSTDATHAMFNYITMAINYEQMGQLANAMRLLQDHVREDYEVTQTDAGKPMIDMFKSLGRTYTREYRKTGEGTKTVQQIIRYIDRQFFNETKRKEGNVEVFNPFTREKTQISKDSTFNLLLYLTSVSRMGLNALSGMTNISQGEMQMLAEAISGRYFGIKELAWSKKEYGKLLLDYVGNFNSVDRHDKMYMLINQFNSSEDYFRDMKDKDFNKSAFKRVLGRGNIYFLNSMGEHYLHTSGMLMVLKREKVKRRSNPNEEVSLYDVIKQVHDENGWRLELDDDIEFVDKNKSFLLNFGFHDGPAVVTKDQTDKLFENLAVYINKINADMHGGYSEAEKGNSNQVALWRFVLQFRQWMFGMYNKLYSRSYYDAVQNIQREGGFISMGKFVTGVLMDMKNMSLKAAIENNHLTVAERQNVKVAMATSMIFTCLMIMVRLTAGWKDEDDRALRLMAYNIRRLELETGALSIAPLPHRFIKNIFTLIQSPAAGIDTMETIAQLFNITAYLDDIDSGRYKGWPRPLKAAWQLTPFYNIQKLIDMKDYNYMFNIFN